MSFYMITYGFTQIDKLYIGKTKEEVVANARELINGWPEYEVLSDEEIIEIASSDQCEFDLVKINAKWPGQDYILKYLIDLYEYQYSGRVPPLPKPKLSDYI